MRLHRYQQNLQLTNQGSVITVGNFDGFHLGHQKLLKRVIATAKQKGLQSVLVTFEPLSKEFFSGKSSPARLMRGREKFEWLKKTELDHLIVIKFDEVIAALSAEDFVTKLLGEQLNLHHLIVGGDFRFGRQRQGDWQLLETLATTSAFVLERFAAVELDGEKVSSSRVRQALADNDFASVERLLGRRYCLAGRVCHGDKRGRELGFPTTNLFMPRINSPVSGIYVVQMYGVADKPLPGVASIGTRPTIGGKRMLLEVFLFDFNREIYGQFVEVELLHKLREEEYYPSLEALTKQINLDAEQARAFFANSVSIG